jgi:hypothetical protein
MHGLHPFGGVDDQDSVEDVPSVRITLHLYLGQIKMPDILTGKSFGSTSLEDDG